MRLRAVPSARPKRELAPSATITYRARTGRVVPASLSWTIAPLTRPSSMIGSVASVAGHKVAPAFTARWATMSSSSRRRTT